ncbi:MAG: amidohydrolase [SAR202 cluster bacterium]|nr:amidohydrolase [SAR202 cluster bacterium]
MLIVDTHCHAGLNWFEPIEMLLRQMELNGVEKATLVQHRGAYDNSYLIEAAKKHPGKFAVVAIVDVSKADAGKALEGWARKGAVGVRLNASDRSPGKDLLAIWKKASELGLTVSVSGQTAPYASEEFEGLVVSMPKLPMVIEHLGNMKPGEKAPYSTYKRILSLAKYSNTYIKVGGLGEISERPPVLTPEFGFDYTPPLVDMALEAFGPKRVMWGSDYPPVSNREGYGNALAGIRDYPALKSKSDREWVMGKAAMEVWRF